MRRVVIFFVMNFGMLAPMVALAGEADVVGVEVTKQGQGRFRFDVTVRHADEGWDHYADRWEVLGPDGAALGVRELAHPHVNEQPFTRLAERRRDPGGRGQGDRACAGQRAWLWRRGDDSRCPALISAGVGLVVRPNPVARDELPHVLGHHIFQPPRRGMAQMQHRLGRLHLHARPRELHAPWANARL